MCTHHVLLSTILCSLLATQAPTASDLPVLNRSIALTRLKGTSADAAASILADADVPGGVISIYDGCAQPVERVFSLQGATLRQGLDYISTVDGTRKWIYREGVVIVGFRLAGKTALSTVLGDVVIDSKDSLSLSTQRLLDSAEVRERINKTGLVELNTPLGFSAVGKPETRHLQARPQPQSTHLNGKSLEQALNILASSSRKAVWHYEQFVCGPKTSFRISWLVH